MNISVYHLLYGFFIFSEDLILPLHPSNDTICFAFYETQL